MKKMFLLSVIFFAVAPVVIAQYVGIGTTTPTHPLTVVSSGDGIVSKDGTVEVGTYVSSTTAYIQTYSNHPLYFSTNNGSTQMALATNGNFGIGVTNPTNKLDVAGVIHNTNDINTAGDLNATGDVTVQGGKGIIRAVNSTQLKYYSRDAGFSLSGLGAFASFDATINFTGGIFTSAPRVIVGDIVASPAPTGEFQKAKLVIFATDNNSCSVRIYNESNAAITFSATWSIICIGN